jgi:hypothetical protein
MKKKTAGIHNSPNHGYSNVRTPMKKAVASISAVSVAARFANGSMSGAFYFNSKEISCATDILNGTGLLNCSPVPDQPWDAHAYNFKYEKH